MVGLNIQLCKVEGYAPREQGMNFNQYLDAMRWRLFPWIKTW